MLKNELLNKRYGDLDYEYNLLMSSLRISVSKHLMDEHFTVLWANNHYYDIIGYTKEEYEEKYHNHCSEFFNEYPQEYSKLVAIVNEAVQKNKSSYDHICKIRHKDGSYLWIKLIGTFTKEIIDGIPIAYTVFTDVSDLMQMRTEQTITYDNLPGFIAKFRVCDAEPERAFEFVDSNERFVQFFGERTPEAPPYALVNLDTERNRHTLAVHYPEMRKGKPVHFVVQVKDKDGNDAWLQINADCIDCWDDDPVYLVVYIDITDITEQKELQKRLEERSEMLRSALEMAERANRAKSDFLSRMSHDIRTPMNAIMGMIAIAKDSLDDTTCVEDCLNKVETSAKFLLSLINDILDMSKIESGKMILKKKYFDFAVFIRNITTMFHAQAQKKGVRFRVTVGEDLQEAYIGDELKLNQILINLLGNAVKFTDAGGTVKLSVATGRHSEKSTEVIFAVKDSGIGMDPAFMEKIFQPFEQDTGQRENRGGSGLGLAIAGNYARMMNGGIHVQSRPGEGSCFTVHVWLESVAERPLPVDLKECFHRQKALVVEADRGACAYAARLLEKYGVSVTRAATEEQALAALADGAQQGAPFTVMLVNWKLPHLDVIGLIRNARGRFTADTLGVAVAAYDWGSIKNEALEAGVNYFLQKPLFASTVYDFLMSVTQAGSISVENEERERFDGECVLLAEDNDINLEIAQTLLERRNLRVESARDGEEAVEMFRSREPGYYFVILMDIQMPVMDGLEATERIRALDKEDALTIPIIAMSANAFDEDVEKSLNAGMTAHVSKPVDVPELFETLRRFKQ